MVGRARAGPGRIRRVNSNPLSLIEVPMPRFDRVEVIIPFGLALFGLFLASSGSLGALQALWLRRRGANLETLKL
jgi:hypothetical protein